jgi:hypothetical protein
MDDVTIVRVTGVWGMASGRTFGQFPLWLVGASPSVYDRSSCGCRLEVSCSVA